MQLLQASCDAGSERAAALLQELDNVSDGSEMKKSNVFSCFCLALSLGSLSTTASEGRDRSKLTRTRIGLYGQVARNRSSPPATTEWKLDSKIQQQVEASEDSMNVPTQLHDRIGPCPSSKQSEPAGFLGMCSCIVPSCKVANEQQTQERRNPKTPRQNSQPYAKSPESLRPLALQALRPNPIRQAETLKP